MAQSNVIVVDDNLRTMTIPADIKLLGVESDDDVNKIVFQLPKMYNGFDLSQFSARINYLNANAEGDVYIAEDLSAEGDVLTFTWLVGRMACMYKGDVNFIVCLKKFKDDGSGEVLQEFNTTVYKLPVLEGLETTEAVVQQYPDIIEYLLNKIEDAKIFDPTKYYTKEDVDELIPTKLPNPERLSINGTEYDGSVPVDMVIEATSEVVTTAYGKLIHLVDALPHAIKDLKLYDENGLQLQSGQISIANKNLFRIDLLADQVTSKGVTFHKEADGGIKCSGTSTGTYAMTSCDLDKNMFVVGKTYTLSSHKAAGYTYVQLIINYIDGTTAYMVARNSPRTFVIEKDVASVTGSVQLTDSGVTVDNEIVYPQLEVSDIASAFAMNTIKSILYDGSVQPVLPSYIANVWASDDEVANMEMKYDADIVVNKIDTYIHDNGGTGSGTGGTLVAIHDGINTLSLGLR